MIWKMLLSIVLFLALVAMFREDGLRFNRDNVNLGWNIELNLNGNDMDVPSIKDNIMERLRNLGE